MKTHRKFTGALSAALAIAAISTVAWAGPGPGPGPKECGLIGTWSGSAGSSLVWLAIHTAGSTDDKNGEMLLDWVYVSPYLLNPSSVTVFTGSPATRMTGGHGVWQQISKGQYKGQYNYTWYTYGINADGFPVYTVRVTGVAATAKCDDVSISYTYEVFPPTFPPQNVSGTPLYSTSDGAAETRVPLTVTP
jgi:hypothetical protein